MDLYSKIIILCPNLTPNDFAPGTGTIQLRQSLGASEAIIGVWNNTEYPQPTQAQLDAIS